MQAKKVVGWVVALVVVLAIGFILWASLASNDSENPKTGNESSNQTDSSSSLSDSYLEPANKGEMVDATGQSNYTIHVDDFIYKTTVLKVRAGTKVTWVNDGQIQHNVVSSDESSKKGLDGPLLSSGQTYSFTFKNPGTYKYHCQPHPTLMRGIVNVVE